MMALKKLTLLLGVMMISFSGLSQEVNTSYLLDLFQSQRFKEASDYLKASYPEPITDKKVLARLGYSFQMAGKLTEAESYYSRILEQDSTDLSVLFSLAGINQRKGNYARATGFYKQILGIDSTNFSVYKQLSNMTEANSGLVFAAPYLAKANQLNPTDAEVAYDYSRVLKSARYMELADSVLDVAIAADSGNLLLLRGSAELSYALKKWPEVKQSCDKILSEGDSTFQVVKMLGEAHFYMKNYPRTIELLGGLEAKSMENEAILYFLAMSYKAMKNQPKAIEYFYKTIDKSISPNVADYYAHIGDSYETSKSAKKALASYQKSLQFDPKPMTYYAIANIYDRQLKNKPSALRYFKRYLAAKPSPKEQKAYIDYSAARIAELSP